MARASLSIRVRSAALTRLIGNRRADSFAVPVGSSAARVSATRSVFVSLGLPESLPSVSERAIADQLPSSSDFCEPVAKPPSTHGITLPFMQAKGHHPREEGAAPPP